MSGELRHVSVSTSLTQAEWEDVNTHYVDSSAQGDLMYLTSSGGIQRLAAGGVKAVLVSGGTSGANPSWSTISTWAPTITQSSAITITVSYANYVVVGRIAHAEAKITIDSAGSASTGIVVGGFPAAIAPRYTTGDALCGAGDYNDAGTRYVLGLVATSSSMMQPFSNAGTTWFGTNPAVTVATGDVLSINLRYEVTTG